ncbi:MAG: phytanoyl-CoA dioxygenase family protein [Spirochaetaceae bacterium]|nr:MAG: phytanoyl-CoA dioxygenase family protein [Spirochaetaceae bacterium]
MVDFQFSDDEVERFNRDGFILGPEVIEPDKIEGLVSEVMRVIDERDRTDIAQPVWVRDMTGGKSERPVWQIVNIWQGSKAFEELMRSPGVAAAAAQLMRADELRIWHDQIQYKPAQTGGKTGWHQDSMAWPPIAPKGRQITAWIALDDADEQNGAMTMVSGSHLWGPADEALHNLEDFYKLPAEYAGHPFELVYQRERVRS